MPHPNKPNSGVATAHIGSLHDWSSLFLESCRLYCTTISTCVAIRTRTTTFESNSHSCGISRYLKWGVIVGLINLYIVVYSHAETWTMWQANATTDTRLLSVGEECAESPKVNTTPPKIVPPGTVATNETTPNGNSTISVPTETPTAKEPSTGMHVGVIAGIVVGGVIGSGLLAAALVICWMRKRRQTKRSISETDIALTKYGHESEQLTPIWHEKPGESAHELPSARIPAHELPVKERPNEVPGRYWDG